MKLFWISLWQQKYPPKILCKPQNITRLSNNMEEQPKPPKQTHKKSKQKTPIANKKAPPTRGICDKDCG